MEIELIVGKVYEYVCAWARPLLLSKDGSGWPPKNMPIKYILPGQTFIIIEKMKRTNSHVKVYVTESSEIGWIYTGALMGKYTPEEEQRLLSAMFKRLI